MGAMKLDTKIRQEQITQAVLSLIADSVFCKRVRASRLTTDYTARIISNLFDASVPLEVAHILWQR